ncbi:hypothetical protein D3C86_1708600 [compost metagenome]
MLGVVEGAVGQSDEVIAWNTSRILELAEDDRRARCEHRVSRHPSWEPGRTITTRGLDRLTDTDRGARHEGVEHPILRTVRTVPQIHASTVFFDDGRTTVPQLGRGTAFKAAGHAGW